MAATKKKKPKYKTGDKVSITGIKTPGVVQRMAYFDTDSGQFYYTVATVHATRVYSESALRKKR